MPWTTIRDLRPLGDSDSDNLEVPNDEEKLQFTGLYYFRDIQRVLEIVDLDDFSGLVERDVWFDWQNSNWDNIDHVQVYAIKVLAAMRADGTLYENVAVAWPPYYKREEEAQARFPGDPNLEPGQLLSFF